MDEDMRRAIVHLSKAQNELLKARSAIATDKNLWEEVDTVAGATDDLIKRWRREHG